MRQTFQSLESNAAAALESRMEAESEGDFSFRNSSDSEAIDEYRISMQNTMKKLSTTSSGYIVWLRLDPELPRLEEIKAEKVFLSEQHCNDLSDKLRSAARRFDDTSDHRILEGCHNTCSFKECRLSYQEKCYIETLQRDPMKLANDVRDDWHPLPLSRLNIDKVCFFIILIIAIAIISCRFCRNF